MKQQCIFYTYITAVQQCFNPFFFPVLVRCVSIRPQTLQALELVQRTDWFKD
jgi:hypothetical protein